MRKAFAGSFVVLLLALAGTSASPGVSQTASSFEPADRVEIFFPDGRAFLGDSLDVEVEVEWPGFEGGLVAWASPVVATCPSLPQDALALPGRYFIGSAEAGEIFGAGGFFVESGEAPDGLTYTGSIPVGSRVPYLLCAWAYQNSNGLPDPASVRLAAIRRILAHPPPLPWRNAACPGNSWRWQHYTPDDSVGVSRTATYFAGLRVGIGARCASGSSRNRYPYRVCIRDPRGRTRCWSKVPKERETRYVLFRTIPGLAGTYKVTWRRAAGQPVFMAKQFRTFAGE